MSSDNESYFSAKVQTERGLLQQERKRHSVQEDIDIII